MSSYRSAMDNDARGFNISDFRAYKDRAGIISTHDFHIEIPWPLALQDPSGGLKPHQQNLEFACDSVNFPGIGADISKVQRYSYGAWESRPTFPIFGDLHCTFMTDQYAMTWEFFNRWQQLAVNYDFSPFQAQSTYEISYKDEYAVDMFLYIYDQFGQLARKVSFRQAFPTMVPDINFNWAQTNAMVKVPVTFAFMEISDWPVTSDRTK